MRIGVNRLVAAACTGGPVRFCGRAAAAAHIRRRGRPTTSTPIMASRSPIPTAGWRTTTRPRPRRGSRRRTRSRSAISTRIPYRRAMAARVRALNDYERYSAPSRKAQYVFFRKNAGLQDQSVLYIQKGFEGTPEVLIDPNAWGTKTSPVPLTTFSAVEGREVRGLRQVAERIGLAGIPRHRARHEEDARRHAPVGQGVQRGVGGRRILLQPLSGARSGQGQGGDQREPSGVLPQGRDAAVAGSAGLLRSGESPALPHRRDDRRRAVRDPVGVGARQGQGRECALRPRSRRRREGVQAADPRHHERQLLRHRQRRRQAARRHQQGGAEHAGRPDRSEAAGGGELEDGAARAAGAAGQRQHGGREAVRHLHQGRDDARLRARAGRTARERDRAARPRHGDRFRRRARQHVRVLHVQLAERAADDLSLRHRREEDERVPAAEGPRLRPCGVRDEADLLHQQGRHARCRCSSSIARA